MGPRYIPRASNPVKSLPNPVESAPYTHVPRRNCSPVETAANTPMVVISMPSKVLVTLYPIWRADVLVGGVAAALDSCAQAHSCVRLPALASPGWPPLWAWPPRAAANAPAAPPPHRALPSGDARKRGRERPRVSLAARSCRARAAAAQAGGLTQCPLRSGGRGGSGRRPRRGNCVPPHPPARLCQEPRGSALGSPPLLPALGPAGVAEPRVRVRASTNAHTLGAMRALAADPSPVWPRHDPPPATRGRAARITH